jgi:hypothetical protein
VHLVHLPSDGSGSSWLRAARRLLDARRMKRFAYLLLLAGCTVMVNGKPRKIGGSSSSATPTAQPSGQPAAQPTRQAAPAKARPAAAAAVTIKVDDTLTSVPIVARAEAAFDTTYSKQYGVSTHSPDCGNDITSQPIASVVLAKPAASLEIAVTGGTGDGFVLRKGDSIWFTCTYSIGAVPSIAKLSEGWQPGRYDIYPISRYPGHAKSPAFEVEVSDPSKPAVWSSAVKQVAITGKLATPMFVEVATKPNRRKLREHHAGYGCDKAAFANEPDLALAIARPVPGLVVRPLPSPVPVTLRKELRDDNKPQRGCPRAGEYRGGPSYHADSEIHFGNEDEGTYGISLGTADAGQQAKVTLMIFDASTKLDPLASYPYTGSGNTLEGRWLGFHFPQLDLRELDATKDYAHAELAAKLFALAPASALVYAKLDLDKDIASGPSEVFPRKNEPLLLIDVDGQRADVLTADGLVFRVKTTHLVLKPDGAVAIPSAPRPLGKLSIGAVIGLLPPSAKGLATAHDKRLDNWEKCNDRVWAPYGRQLPSYTHPAGVDVVVYESPRTRAIKEAGQAAMDKTCGSDEKIEKQTEAERVKMMVEVEKARAKLLAQATANLR